MPLVKTAKASPNAKFYSLNTVHTSFPYSKRPYLLLVGYFVDIKSLILRNKNTGTFRIDLITTDLRRQIDNETIDKPYKQ